MTTLEDQITPQQSLEQEMDARLASLAETILKTRNEAVEGRAASGIERQWRADQRAFEGMDGTVGAADMLDFATGNAWLEPRDKKQKQSRVLVNIIRGKCETAEGRFSELQFPTDDKNWGLLVPPVPEASVTLMGSQVTDDEKAADLKKRCSAMEKEIEDQLEECNFNAECRKVVRSAVRLGAGVLKGPNVVKTLKRAWIEQSDAAGSVYVMQTMEQFAPKSVCCNIWNIYPDPHCGSDPKRGAYLWERDDHVLPRDVRALMGVKGYNRRQLKAVLEEEPLRTVVQIDKGGSHGAASTRTTKGSPYERWEYHGDVDRETLESIGCTCPDDDGGAYSACIVFINDRPVKVTLNAIDTGELPYDFFQWVEIEDSPWGIGEVRKIIWQQRIITAAWRAMMDNAGASAGTILVLGKDVEPEDDDWGLNGNKIFVNYADDQDVSKAFAQYQIANNQVPLQNIIELALRFTDLESGTPALAQGEKGSAPETLGGMQLLMSGADTGRRRLVKQWDDQITRPHIQRYNDWNMQYNPKQEIKGAYTVDARGTSTLLVKEQSVESLMQVLQLRNDPEVNLQVDWSKVIKQLFQARHLDVLKDDKAIEEARAQAAQQPPPQAPQVQVAEIRAKTEMERAQLQGQVTLKKTQIEAEADIHRTDVDTDRDTALVNAAAEKNANDAALRMKELEMRREIEILKYSTQQKISLEDAKVQLARDAMKLNTQKQLAAAAGAMDIEKHYNPPQVATPAMEPTGKAPDGQAFQR